MCVHFDKVCVSNLILVDHDGKVIEGDYAVNRAGFVLRTNVHAEHPHYCLPCPYSLWHGMGSNWQAIDPITQDACAFEDHVVIGDEAGAVAVENHAGSNVAKAFAGVKAAIPRITGC